MSTGSVDDRENQLAAQAEALDLALAAGEAPTLAQGDADSGEAFSALLAAHATLQLLERVWPRGTPRTAQRAESERDAAPRAFGRFRVIKELGRGGFGVVFLAIDPQLNRPVALKLPLAEALLQSEVRQRFLREARAAGARSSQRDSSLRGRRGQFDLLPGFVLLRWTDPLGVAAQTGERPSLRTTRRLVADMASAVRHSHDRGILHRDLKPSNVIMDLGRRAWFPRSQAPEGSLEPAFQRR